MLVQAFWETDTKMARDFYLEKCQKDKEEGAGEGKRAYRWWYRSGPCGGAREEEG